MYVYTYIYMYNIYIFYTVNSEQLLIKAWTPLILLFSWCHAKQHAAKDILDPFQRQCSACSWALQEASVGKTLGAGMQFQQCNWPWIAGDQFSALLMYISIYLYIYMCVYKVYSVLFVCTFCIMVVCVIIFYIINLWDAGTELLQYHVGSYSIMKD